MASSVVVKEDTRVDLLRLGTCPKPPLVIAVGGGGRSDGYYSGGGGSGYVEHAELLINQSYVELTVDVGSAGEPSTVSAGGETYISAEGGGNGMGSSSGCTSENGGSGYSGGGRGGNGPGDGGEDGGDGQDCYNCDCGIGGTGSGTDISGILIKGYSLRYFVIIHNDK